MPRWSSANRKAHNLCTCPNLTQTMILAGSDTTATTLAFALGELSRRPELAAAAAAEVRAALGGADPKAVGADVYQKLPLIAGIAYETLRLYPAVTETGRECVQVRAAGGGRLVAGKGMGRCLRLLVACAQLRSCCWSHSQAV